MPQPAKILVIDDHPLFRDAVSTAARFAFPETRTFETSSIEAALELLEVEGGIDIALLDLNLPGVTGFDGLLRLRSQHPRLPILVVSGLESEQIILGASGCGAAGFVPKSLGREVLGEAIKTILEGGVYFPEGLMEHEGDDEIDTTLLAERVSSLTPQQLKVLTMLREGLLNKQIAHELNVGSTTVKKHVSEILRKLHVHSRTQAVIEVAKLERDDLFKPEQRFNQVSSG